MDHVRCWWLLRKVSAPWGCVICYSFCNAHCACGQLDEKVNTDSVVVAVRKESRRRRDGNVVRFVGCDVRVACVGRLMVFDERR